MKNSKEKAFLPNTHVIRIKKEGKEEFQCVHNPIEVLSELEFDADYLGQTDETGKLK